MCEVVCYIDERLQQSNIGYLNNWPARHHDNVNNQHTNTPAVKLFPDCLTGKGNNNSRYVEKMDP